MNDQRENLCYGPVCMVCVGQKLHPVQCNTMQDSYYLKGYKGSFQGYSLLTQLALINSSLNELLQSLSAFLARVIMNQHLPVQSICLALLVIRVRYRVRTYFNSKQLPITQMKQGNFQTWSVYWKSLPPMPQLWIRRNNGLEVSKVVLDSPEVLEMVITCSSY